MNSQEIKQASSFRGNSENPQQYLERWFKAKALPLPSIEKVSSGLYCVTFFDSSQLFIRATPADAPPSKKKAELRFVYQQLIEDVTDNPSLGDSFIATTKKLATDLYAIPQYCFPPRKSHEAVQFDTLRREFCMSTDSTVRTVLTANADTCDEWIETHVLGSHNALATRAKHITNPLCRVVGYDTESLPRFGAPNILALIQISTATDVLLFEVFRLRALPLRLRLLLESPRIAKVGLAMDGEEEALRARFHINCSALVELDALSQQLGFAQRASLKALTDRFLSISLRKDKRLTLHRWGVKPLGTPQIDYAATDAWIAYHIFFAMKAVIGFLDAQGLTLGQYCSLLK